MFARPSALMLPNPNRKTGRAFRGRVERRKIDEEEESWRARPNVLLLTPGVLMWFAAAGVTQCSSECCAVLLSFERSGLSVNARARVCVCVYEGVYACVHVFFYVKSAQLSRSFRLYFHVKWLK